MRKILAFAAAACVLGAASLAFAADAPKAADKPADKPAATPAKPADKPAAAPAKPADKPAAAAPAKMEPPKPGPELEAMKWMAGNWKCTGKMNMPPEMGGGQMDYKSSMKVKQEHKGFWYVGESKMDKTKTMPEMKATYMWGWDPVNKKYIQSYVDDSGAFGMATSAGFEGDKQVYAGDGVMMGKKMNNKMTLTKKSDKEITVAFDVEGEPGKWATMAEESCKK